MEKLTIRAFQPASDPRATNEYIAQHRQVLEDHGVSNAITPPNEWLRNPGVVLIVAEHPSLGMVGGIRIQPAMPGHPVPMRSSLVELDPSASSSLRFLEGRGTAEVCGLWNAHRFSGKGLPLLLSMAAVSIAPWMNTPTLVCFVAFYTARHARKNGFIPIESIGQCGEFNYPIPEIRSTAMVIPDAYSLETAPAEHRGAILSLRTRPFQERVEMPSQTPIKVRYMLHWAGKGMDLRPFGRIQESYVAKP